MSRVSTKAALVALIALAVTLGAGAPSFAAKGKMAHGKHMAGKHMGRRHMAKTEAAAPVAAGPAVFGLKPRPNDGPFGPNNILGGINGNGKASGGAEDPANFRAAGLDNGGLLGTGLLGGQGVLGLGILGF